MFISRVTLGFADWSDTASGIRDAKVMKFARKGIMETLLGATFPVYQAVQSVLRHAFIAQKQARVPELQFSRA